MYKCVTSQIDSSLTDLFTSSWSLSHIDLCHFKVSVLVMDSFFTQLIHLYFKVCHKHILFLWLFFPPMFCLLKFFIFVYLFKGTISFLSLYILNFTKEEFRRQQQEILKHCFKELSSLHSDFLETYNSGISLIPD
jgi:hypothetical protein